MHAHRAPSFPRVLLARALAAALPSLAWVALAWLAPASVSAQARAIVLSFEGWHADQARSAVADALSQQYFLVSEEQAINAAAQIAADVSTPEGMAAVVQHLGIELVVGGSVSGTGRRSSTTIFVLDRNGNEIGNATAPGPTGRAAVQPIGAAALQACANAMLVLHPPQQEPIITDPGPEQGGGQEEPPPEEPPMRSLEDIENERPGQSRGQGGGSYQEPEHHDEGGGGSERWSQPIFRGLFQLDLRNRAALISPFSPIAAQAGNFADFYPQLGFSFELRPMAQSDDALRGLYARLDLWFSAGINYYSTLDVDPLPLQTFGIEVDVGYAATIAEVVELFATIGFGYDSYALTLPLAISDLDLPSTAYPYIPINVGGRIRLLPSSVAGADLHLEALVGPRIMLGGGEIAQTVEQSDYYYARTSFACGTDMVVANCGGDFGGLSGAGLNLQAGLGLIIDPGFSAALRFQYVNYFMSFSGGQGTREAVSGTDESLHIQILAGWAIR